MALDTPLSNYVDIIVYGLIPLGIISAHVVVQQSPSKLSRPASLAYICHHSWAFQLALTTGLIPAFYTNVHDLFTSQWSTYTSFTIMLLNSLALGFVAVQLLTRAAINARDEYFRAILSRDHGPIVNIRLVRID